MGAMTKAEIKKHARAIAILRGWNPGHRPVHDFNPNKRVVYNSHGHTEHMELDKLFEATEHGERRNRPRHRA